MNRIYQNVVEIKRINDYITKRYKLHITCIIVHIYTRCTSDVKTLAPLIYLIGIYYCYLV